MKTLHMMWTEKISIQTFSIKSRLCHPFTRIPHFIQPWLHGVAPCLYGSYCIHWVMWSLLCWRTLLLKILPDTHVIYFKSGKSIPATADNYGFCKYKTISGSLTFSCYIGFYNTIIVCTAFLCTFWLLMQPRIF